MHFKDENSSMENPEFEKFKHLIECSHAGGTGLYIEPYPSHAPVYEYVTCIKEENTKKWNCILGAFEASWGRKHPYEYKVMKIQYVPTILTKPLLELLNPDCVLHMK
jgi:hypothetical protein